eukprot:TRINITY_DN12188_c0_g1_i1.p1 TRINITY_DN12188_c0_g1~~TRINITY_DN12188_c0_g1_i1.p1  ORF type:complete len:392 (+),score=64.97 TRINITY_DN12188_c0_g1_i1:174-1178(+)
MVGRRLRCFSEGTGLRAQAARPLRLSALAVVAAAAGSLFGSLADWRRSLSFLLPSADVGVAGPQPAGIGGSFQTLAASRAISSLMGRAAIPPPDETTPQFRKVIGEDVEEVWDQTVQELALDVRELLITDGNLFFVGPDTETYYETAKEVADLLNYTFVEFDFKSFDTASKDVSKMECVYIVPPLVSARRWPWSFMMHTGLTVWLDVDGYKKLNVYDRDRLRKVKFPKKKAAFGPEKPPDLLRQEPPPPADPIDMWMESDVHVDFKRHPNMAPTKLVLASTINAILESPPLWRGWVKQAKARGTVSNDYQNPLEVRRSFHSHGVSPRLNRLLNA